LQRARSKPNGHTGSLEPSAARDCFFDEHPDHLSLFGSVPSSSSPRSPGLFFEHEQRRRLGKGLVFACEPTAQRAHLATFDLNLRRVLSTAESAERLCTPLVDHRGVDPFAAQIDAQLALGQRRGFEDDRELLVRRPRLRLFHQ